MKQLVTNRIVGTWREWSGTAPGTAASVPTNSLIRSNNIQTLDFGNFKAATITTPDTYSAGKVVSLKLNKTPVAGLSTYKARMYTVHGQNNPNIELNALVSATYAPPLTAGAVQQTDGTDPVEDPILSDPFTCHEVALSTDEYKFLYMQFERKALCGARDWTQCEGESGIWILCADVPVQVGVLTGNPVGDALDLLVHAYKIGFFVADTDWNGNVYMNRIGCYEKEFTVTLTQDTAEMLKGDPQVVVSEKVTKQGAEIKGKFKVLNKWAMSNLIAGVTVDDTNTAYSRMSWGAGNEALLPTRPVYLQAISNDGKMNWFTFPVASMRYDGDITMGSDDGGSIGFAAKALGGIQWLSSQSYYQPCQMAMVVKYTAS